MQVCFPMPSHILLCRAVFVNKILMDPKKGFGFVFATSLCSLHFFASGAFVKMSEAVGYGQSQSVPFKGKQ